MAMKVPVLPLTMKSFTAHVYCSRAKGNVHDSYAVKVIKLGIVVDCLPVQPTSCF